MLKAFFRDSAIYGALRVLTSGITVLLIPLYTRLLRPAEYGVVDVITVAATIAIPLLTLEIVQGFARLYMMGGDQDRRAYASTAFWFVAASFALFTAAVAVFAPQLSLLAANTAQYAGAIRIAAASLTVQTLFYVVLTDLRYALRPWAYAAASLVFSVTSISAAAICLIVFRLGIAGVFVAQLCGNVAGLAVAMILARKDFALRFEVARLRQMLHFSLPLVLSMLAVLSASYADRFAVRSLLAVAALGVYAVGARLASAVAVAINAVQAALSPLIYRHHDDPGAAVQLERIFRWFLAATTLIVLFLGAFAAEVLRLFASGEYAGAAQVMFLLALASVLANLYLFAPGLWIAKRTGVIAAINTAVAVVTFGLNLIAIPRMGIRGAAMVACTVALAGFIVQLSLAQRLYRVPYAWKRIGGAAIVMLIFAIFVAPIGEIRGGAEVIAAKAGVFVLFGTVCTWIFLGGEELRLLLAAVKRVAG